MGMAASQARFLGLTARKNNVEFEGQQINQQRTTLSNQSANYYNDLLGMSVPTPPSVDSYTKTVYTFSDGALTNTITALIAQSNGKYTLSYLSQYEDDFSPIAAGTSVITAEDIGVVGIANDDNYYVGSTLLRKNLGSPIPLTYSNGGTPITVYAAVNAAGDYVYCEDITNVDGTTVTILPNETLTSNDEYVDSLLSSPEQIYKLQQEESQYLALLNSKYGTPASGWVIRYVENSSTGIWQPYFYKADDLYNGNRDGNGNIVSGIDCYTMGSDTKTVEVKNITDCQVEKDSTGRYITVSIPNTSGTMTTYSLTTTTVTDQDAYEDAMNQYEYDKYLYDQSIQDINAKIEIIQAEDKNLELRLKQLDTEQEAIQTEMDSVEKVIQKNTESTFKTFG